MVTFIFIVGDGMPGFLCRGEWEGRCTLGIGLEWVAVFFDWDHLVSPRGGGRSGLHQAARVYSGGLVLGSL